MAFASVLLLGDTSEPISSGLWIQSDIATTVWGWIGAGTYEMYTIAYWENFTSGYYWSIFGVNVVMTILIGEVNLTSVSSDKYLP